MNRFEAVGRLVAEFRIKNGNYIYIMYVDGERIEVSASFGKPENINIMDYIYVTGYINGHMRREEDGTNRYFQTYTAVSIDKAVPELTKEFDIEGKTADEYFHVFLLGTIYEFVYKTDNVLRFVVSIPADPELKSKETRYITVGISLNRFSDFEGEVGDNICVYGKTASRTKLVNNQTKTYQRIRVEDYALVEIEE